MSVLIKGMEMPTSCDMCWALDDYGDYPRCRITDEQRGYNFNVRGQKMTKCPLIEALPHGDLIDRGELLKGKQHYEYLSGEYYITVRDIEEAPTIVPAEPPKEKTE